PRFADARLTAEQDQLTEALSHTVPAFEEETHFLLATDQRREAPGALDLQPTARGAGAHDLIDTDRRGHAPKRLDTELAAAQAASPQSMLGAADDAGARLRDRLKPGRDVRRLAERQPLLSGAAADLTHHHEPGMNAHPGRERDATA